MKASVEGINALCYTQTPTSPYLDRIAQHGMCPLCAFPPSKFRAEADELMIRHAEKQGVKVFEETRVTDISFENGADPAEARPVSATWSNKSGETGTILFDWLIDASGRQGILSTKYLKNRIFREGLRNVAAYGYWTDKTGWAWLIPLHNGTTSIGVVMHQDTSIRKKQEGPSGLEEHYLEQLKLAPDLQALIGDKGAYIAKSVRGTADYSYHATQYSGDHYRLIGDAAAFVDPLFSSGVHVAMTGALSAAATIIGSMKGQITELEAQSWHDAKIGICQTRFLMVVLSAYRQMHHQGNTAVLSDIDSTSFEAAFEKFRPIYQGEHDTSTKLTYEELSKMIEFTRHLFTPTTHQQFQDVSQRVGKLLDLSGPVMGPDDLAKVLDSEDSDAKAVLQRINSLKILSNDTSPDSFTSEAVNGYVVRLERGSLGLVKA
ncbi:hypothetical protein PHLCEN_2v9298 [Hermanssonia centrifuga]|uniref:Halogenase n=1 Tax=Hermanssonia centrifuga TaxID=98765 RepID=A0A2R6NR69_9APHY|nr:hypothetical protein PHLCEN_2v9298 [Hermanssonia centrifuga]